MLLLTTPYSTRETSCTRLHLPLLAAKRGAGVRPGFGDVHVGESQKTRSVVGNSKESNRRANTSPLFKRRPWRDYRIGEYGRGWQRFSKELLVMLTIRSR